MPMLDGSCLLLASAPVSCVVGRAAGLPSAGLVPA